MQFKLHTKLHTKLRTKLHTKSHTHLLLPASRAIIEPILQRIAFVGRLSGGRRSLPRVHLFYSSEKEHSERGAFSFASDLRPTLLSVSMPPFCRCFSVCLSRKWHFRFGTKAPKSCPSPAQVLSKSCPSPIQVLSKSYPSPIQVLPKPTQAYPSLPKPTHILPIFYPYSTRACP